MATQVGFPGMSGTGWRWQMLLATLLGFCSEIILWTNPTRSIGEWLLLAVGYLALSGLLLELAARFRLRDPFGLLALAGIYGMLNGLILNPQTALFDVPRTLISRAMGAHTFAGLLALTLFFGLAGGGLRTRHRLIAALVLTALLGVGWGLWAHWSPLVISGTSETPPETLAIYTIGGVVLVAAGLWMTQDRSVSAEGLRLSVPGWAFTLVVLVGLTVAHLLQGEIGTLSLIVIITLSAFSIMILIFQKRRKGAILLDGLTHAPPFWLALGLLVIVFGAAGVIGYGLPRGDGTKDPLALIGALFTAYGLIWLPAVSLVLGARGFSRQAKAMRL